MKKIFSILAVVILIISTMFLLYNCDNNNIHNPKNYLKEIPGGKIKKIINRDIKGAMEGFSAAAGVAKIIFPNDQNIKVIAGCLGAIYYGADASIEEYGKMGKPGDRTGAGNNIARNDNNPYDYVGFNHYSTLKNRWYIDFTIVSLPPHEESVDYLVHSDAISQLTQNQIMDEDDSIYITLENLRDVKTAYETYNNSDTTIESLLTYMFAEGTITGSTHDILIAYLAAYDTCSTLETFLNYSISEENAILNFQSLNDEEKAIILIYVNNEMGYILLV